MPYKITKQLRLIGFNEECFGYYTLDGYDRWYFKLVTEYPFKTTIKNYNIAPLYQQVFDWFRNRGVYFIEAPMREENPAYFVFKPGLTDKNYGPFLIDIAIEKAINLSNKTA